ncbi:hypothetical protein T440DRAFT_518618 [Plenodomus tracheiphilus IPT5]|uniref:Uncharacterized protein n=1 Tax=Plenodomus tracheiphilus IPT5 TaxID=1408161 RepID=A0A6A7B6Y9_9PLEO|nr:hypothetical protein T440DRAFT_518618 [Plenodomus tracheiphilus IPT5]
MVIAFLSFGVAVTIVGAVRTSVLVKVFVLEEVVSDPTYSVSDTLTNIESSLGIIGTCDPTIKYLLGFCVPALKAADEPTNRNYIHPSGGSQGEMRKKRHTRGTDAHDTFQKLEEVELTDIHRAQRRPSQNLELGGDMGITKTIAWTVDGAQQDTNGACEQSVSTPRIML